MQSPLFVQFAALWGATVLIGASITLVPMRIAGEEWRRHLRNLRPHLEPSIPWQDAWRNDPRGSIVRDLGMYREHHHRS